MDTNVRSPTNMKSLNLKWSLTLTEESYMFLVYDPGMMLSFDRDISSAIDAAFKS